MAAPVKSKVTVQGIEGLVANFYASNARVGQFVRATNRRAARQIENLAREFAPEDTGRLKRSITHRLSDDELVFQVFTDPAVFAADGEPDYSIFVELGTLKSPAQPFLFPAFETMRPHYTRDISAAVRRALRESMKGR